MSELDATVGSFWFGLIAVFIIVVPSWGGLKMFGDAGRWTQQNYDSVTERINNRSSWVVTSSWVLLIVGIIWKLALWLSWFFYLERGALAGLQTLFIVIDSVIFAAVVFGVIADIGFWQVGWLGFSLFMRIIEILLVIAAFVLVIIELVDTPSGVSNWQAIFLVIVLGVIMLWLIFVAAVRGYYYWDEAANMQNNEYSQIEPSFADAHSIAHSAAKQRAAQAFLSAKK